MEFAKQLQALAAQDFAAPRSLANGSCLAGTFDQAAQIIQIPAKESLNHWKKMVLKMSLKMTLN